MTVAELIAELQKLPQGAPVEYYTYDDYQDYPVMYMPVERVAYAEAPEDGESNRPSKRLPAVRIG